MKRQQNLTKQVFQGEGFRFVAQFEARAVRNRVTGIIEPQVDLFDMTLEIDPQTDKATAREALKSFNAGEWVEARKLAVVSSPIIPNE